jgi:uncharacterized protein YciW
MRTPPPSPQFERALALMEAQQQLETERRSLSEAQRASDRQAIEQLILRDSEGTSAYMQTLHASTMAKLTELGEKLDRLYEIVGIPKDADVPTLEEQLAAASSDEAVRRRIQQLVAEAEFEHTEIEFH